MTTDQNDLARRIEGALRPFCRPTGAMARIVARRCEQCGMGFYRALIGAEDDLPVLCWNCKAKAPSFIQGKDPLEEAEKRLRDVVTIADLAEACSWMLAEMRQVRADKARDQAAEK